MVGMVGPNEAGKTALFNEITCSLGSETGSVVFNGADLARLKPYRTSVLGMHLSASHKTAVEGPYRFGAGL